MSKMKALLAILLVGVACASIAKAKRPGAGTRTFWVCHKGQPLEVGSYRAAMKHREHGDSLPIYSPTCPWPPTSP